MSTEAVGLLELDRDQLTRWAALLDCSPPRDDETTSEFRDRLRAHAKAQSSEVTERLEREWTQQWQALARSFGLTGQEADAQFRRLAR